MRRRALIIAAAAGVLVVGAAIAHQVVADNALTAVGGVGVSGPSSASAPLVAGVAELRNSGPWPVTITSITSPGVEFAVSLTPLPASGQTLTAGEWLAPDARTTLAPGESRYLWISLPPDGERPTAVESVDIAYEGPLGLSYVERVTTFSVLAVPVSVPESAVSLSGDTDSLAVYLAALRTALVAHDVDAVALLMDASTADAEALLDAQEGVVENMGFTASDDPSPSISFFTSSSAVDGLPPFTARWSDHRWRVTG